MKVVDLSSEANLVDFKRNVHATTHIECPGLFKKGKGVDEYPAELFVTQAVLLDLTHKGAGQAIDDEDLEAAEERAGLSLREGEAVVLHTGRSEGNKAAKKFPYLSQNGAEFLEFKRPSIVGTDAPSLDLPRRGKLRAHKTLMRAGVLLLEGLCNLDKVNQSRFQLIALPLLVRGSASPVRALAILEE